MDWMANDTWLRESSERIEARMLEGLLSPTTRYMMMREAMCCGRKGALHYANDRLVGFISGLMDSLQSLRVRPDLLKAGEVPYPSFYVGQKRWDYLIEDPGAKPVARVEMRYTRGIGRTDSIELLYQLLPNVLAAAYDHRRSGQSCFAGIVIVHRLRTSTRKSKRPNLSARFTAARREKTAHFLRQMRVDGLVDRIAFFEMHNGVLSQPIPDATLAGFLDGLRDELLLHPEMIAPSALQAWHDISKSPLPRVQQVARVKKPRAPRERNALGRFTSKREVAELCPV